VADEHYPGALPAAREAARLAGMFHTEGASASAAAVRELQQQNLVDVGGVQQLLKHWRETQGLLNTRESLEVMRAAQGLKTASASLAGMADAQGFNDSFRKIAELYDSSVRDTMESVQIGAKWREQVRETIEAVGASTAISDQMREALRERQVLAANFTITPVFRAALTEAETLATEAEEATAGTDGPFAHLTDDQRATLQVALLGAMAEVAANMSFFLGVRRVDAAAHLLALLVVLVTLYRAARPSE
jgi:hypothetical protein